MPRLSWTTQLSLISAAGTNDLTIHFCFFQSGTKAIPAQEVSATTCTIDKQAENIQLGEENVDPQSWLRRTEDSRSSLKVTSVFETESTEIKIETISGRSPNNVIGHAPSEGGDSANICDVEKESVAVLCESQNTGGTTGRSCIATTIGINSTVTSMSASYSSIAYPLESATAIRLHSAAVTTSHEHYKRSTMISVPTPNNFTPFESAQRTPTKEPHTAQVAVSPVMLRSRQIKSKIQQLREHYGTPNPLPPLQASPVALKIPFKAPLRPQTGD